MVFTTIFAYPDNFIDYIIAYNVGILGFSVAEKFQTLKIKVFDQLGKIGFAFFLGAGTPMAILGAFFDFESTYAAILTGYILKLIFAVMYAYLVTRWIETPLLNWEREKI